MSVQIFRADGDMCMISSHHMVFFVPDGRLYYPGLNPLMRLDPSYFEMRLNLVQLLLGLARGEYICPTVGLLSSSLSSSRDR
jgi:hypothetical protein